MADTSSITNPTMKPIVLMPWNYYSAGSNYYHLNSNSIYRIITVKVLITTSRIESLLLWELWLKGNIKVLFLITICEHSSPQDTYWRSNIAIVIDNAPYHSRKVIMEEYQHMKLPIMFLGPYQFKLAPVELMFSYIKNRDMNPLNTRA